MVNCFICGTPAKVFDATHLGMFHVDCEVCGAYRFSALLLRQMENDLYWPKTKIDLAKALHNRVVNKPEFSIPRDIMDAIGGLSRSKEPYHQHGE